MTAHASNSMFYPFTLCVLQIVFMIMIIKYNKDNTIAG